jgi:hypothetical protein
VNAGVTHPLEAWLDAMAPAGRMILPLTAAMPAMGNIGKGLVFLIEKDAGGSFAARVTGFVAVYSALGIRDEFLSAQIAKKLMGGPQSWSSVTRLRRDRHDPAIGCWLHGGHFCFST